MPNCAQNPGLWMHHVQPSERERKLHEVTHLPFKRWCSFCVMGKSRANLKCASDPNDLAARTHPTVQVDVFFQTAGNCLLLCVDAWSKYLHIAFEEQEPRSDWRSDCRVFGNT